MRIKIRLEPRLVPAPPGHPAFTLTGRYSGTVAGQRMIWSLEYFPENPILFGLLPHWKQKRCKRRAWRAYIQRSKRERANWERSWAKSQRFAEAYGGGGKGLSPLQMAAGLIKQATVTLDDDTARKTIDAYMKSYPGISKLKVALNTNFERENRERSTAQRSTAQAGHAPSGRNLAAGANRATGHQ